MAAIKHPASPARVYREIPASNLPKRGGLPSNVPPAMDASAPAPAVAEVAASGVKKRGPLPSKVPPAMDTSAPAHAPIANPATNPQYRLVSRPGTGSGGKHAAPQGAVPHPSTPPAAQAALSEAQGPAAAAVPHAPDSNVPTVPPNAPMAVTERRRPGAHAAPKGGGSVGRALNTLDPTASLGPAPAKRAKGGAHRAPKPSTAAKVSKFMGVDAPQAAGAPKRAPMAASVRKNPRKSPAAPPANAPARTPGPQPGLASKVKRIAGKAGAGLGVGMAALAAANQAQKDSTVPSAIRRPAKGGKHAAAKASKHARPSAAVIPASVRGGAHQKKRS